MSTKVRLRPRESELPRCENYGDEHEVRRFERAMRAHRAYTEAFEIEALEGRVDGAYRVCGESGVAYHVDIVDGGGQHDTCTCPDFLTNDLGTCKHAEAVRRAIAARRAWRALYARLPAEPLQPTVGVRFVEAGRPAPALLGPFSSRALARARASFSLDASGRVDPGAGVLRPGRSDDLLRVAYAAPLALDRWQRDRALRQRRVAVEAALKRGRLGVDVLKGALFPYQRDGVAHLVAAGRALLADDMGLGKTVQAIAACEVLRARGEAARVLIVAPTSLKHQWASEIERHAGEQAVIVGGGGHARAEAFRSDAPYKILNYELTWRELSRLQGLDADVLVLDEAQRAKNFRTKTATTLRAIPSRFLFVLTGTPVENRLDDLYSLLQLIDPSLLGPLWRFNHEFHEQNERGKIVGYKNLAKLRERSAPYVLRRRKEAVLDQLPPLTEQYRYVPLDPRQIELEEGLRSDAGKVLAIAERRPLSKEEYERLMKLLLKARQACNALELADPARGERASPKLDEFEAFVAEIVTQGSAKLLVFSEWVGMLRLASERLVAQRVGHLLFHGGVPAEKRGALLDRFRADPDLRVLLCSDAGGVGLNLQIATYVVHLDLPWNPARLDQRTARAHRLGQTRGVSVTYLCAETGIERGIAGALERAVRAAALDADSQVETLVAPSFSLFARQLRSALAAAVPVDHVPPESEPASSSELEATPAPDAVSEATLGDAIEGSSHDTLAEATEGSSHDTLAEATEGSSHDTLAEATEGSSHDTLAEATEGSSHDTLAAAARMAAAEAAFGTPEAVPPGVATSGTAAMPGAAAASTASDAGGALPGAASTAGGAIGALSGAATDAPPADASPLTTR
ncbi:MAG: DEAD/DEAH box helicase, partial [Polyangiaceae bacterium]|nr:DEAD/DEAH box helicase [Polyangiaceae bacterium]